MKLAAARACVPELEWLPEIPSTNAHLRERLASAPESRGLPHGTTVVTTNQTAGRGRAGRGWVTPPDTSLACSVLLRGPWLAGGGADEPDAVESTENSPTRLGVSWLPLIAGSAVVAALQPYFPPELGLRVGVKWPNDVHVRTEADAIAGQPGQKLCGILSELVAPDVVIVGIGINLLIPEFELPTDRATSLLAAGADLGETTTLASIDGAQLVDEVTAAVVSELLRLVDLAKTRPEQVRARVLRHSLTIGSEVRVHLAGGERIDGRARTLAGDGSLVVDLPTGGELVVSAGDIEHLR